MTYRRLIIGTGIFFLVVVMLSVTMISRGASRGNDRFELGGELRVDYGEENTTTNVKGYIKNQLMAQVSLQLDTEYINNSTVAADSSNSEVYSTISLSYDY